MELQPENGSRKPRKYLPLLLGVAVLVLYLFVGFWIARMGVSALDEAIWIHWYAIPLSLAVVAVYLAIMEMLIELIKEYYGKNHEQ